MLDCISSFPFSPHLEGALREASQSISPWSYFPPKWKSKMATPVFSKGRSLKRCDLNRERERKKKQKKNTWLNILSPPHTVCKRSLKWSKMNCCPRVYVSSDLHCWNTPAFSPSIRSLVNFNFSVLWVHRWSMCKHVLLASTPLPRWLCFLERCELLADI